MSRPEAKDRASEPSGHEWFTTTHWSVVLSARDGVSPTAQAAARIALGGTEISRRRLLFPHGSPASQRCAKSRGRRGAARGDDRRENNGSFGAVSIR